MCESDGIAIVIERLKVLEGRQADIVIEYQDLMFNDLKTFLTSNHLLQFCASNQKKLGNVKTSFSHFLDTKRFAES